MSTATFAPSHPSPIFSSPASPFKKQKMSITQTYYLAHKARAKLSHEAAMPDHNLRLLVGHANLLDGLMLELADAEREQESWFNNSVRSASHPSEKAATATENRHIQWADAIPEEEEEDDYEDSISSSDDDDDDEDDSDISDNEDEDEDIEMADALPLRRMPSHKTPASPRLEVLEIDMGDYNDDVEEDEEEEDFAQLSLTRSPSHHSSLSSPPELEHDSDDSSEDESMPPSPPIALLPTFASSDEEKHHQHHNTASSTKQQKDSEDQSEAEAAAAAELYDDSIHYMPTRNPASLVSAISVY